MLSASQLSSPPSRSAIISWMLARARELGFQTTRWNEGGTIQATLDTVATGSGHQVQVSADTVAGYYNETAEGAALTLLSKNQFDNDRDNVAVATSGEMLFTNSGTVAHVVQVGAVLLENENRTQFHNTSAGTIPAGGSVSLEMDAVLTGVAGNIRNNSTLSLVTPLAGVVVTNPGPGDVDLDGFADPWYNLRTGADPETDTTLRARNSIKWGLLSIEKTATGVEALAIKQPGITKAKIIHNNPRGPGTVDVYVANGADTVGASEMEVAQAAFSGYFMGTTDVYPPEAASRYHILEPPTLELEVRGVVYYDPQYEQTEVESNLSTSLTNFVTPMKIGGTEYFAGDGKITLGDLLEVIETTTGVRTFTPTTPTGNIDIASTTLVQAPSDWITGRITFTAVTS